MSVVSNTVAVRDSANVCAGASSIDRERNTPAYWQLERLRKYASDGVARSVHPNKTIRRASAVLEQVGVTRVANVTGLDRLGVPNFMSVRPRDLGPGISYYNGKGTRAADAHAGALMEAIERHAGEVCAYPVLLGSRKQLAGEHACIAPSDIIVPSTRQYSDDLALEWVAGFDLVQSRAILVPLNCVVCPYTARAGSTVFYASTNGIASGNSRTEALCHALCEVIERDTLALAMARSQIKPAIAAILELKKTPTPEHGHQQIRLSAVPARAARIIGKIRKAGLRVFLRNLSAPIGIPTIDCTITEQGSDGVPIAHGGCGTHPDARVALLRALTEATQSRVATIQGGREDLPEVIRPPQHYDVDEEYGSGEWIWFSDIASFDNDHIDDDVRLLLDRLRGSGLDCVVAFDLTRPEIGIPVVRVVIPRAEAWTVFHLHTGRGVFGKRVSDLLS